VRVSPEGRRNGVKSWKPESTLVRDFEACAKCLADHKLADAAGASK
jgi:hypothetical protein